MLPKNVLNFIENLHNMAMAEGNRTAIVYNDGFNSLSYEELDRLSSAVADKIHRSGIVSGTAVPVMMQRDAFSIAAEIGVLKAGAAFVPVIPSYPEERIDYIMNDCGAKLLIDDRFYEDLPEFDSEFEPVSPCEEMVMIIYTSGSTGHPKGVVYDLPAYNETVQRMSGYLAEVDPIIFGGFAPMSFGMHFLEYPAVLNCGGTTHILSDDVRKNPEKLEQYYKNNRISVGFLSPWLFSLFKNNLPDLKKVVFAGEKIFNIDPENYAVDVCYGMTEALDITNYRIDAPTKKAFIGTATQGTEVFLLDDQGKDAGFLREGEICAKGIYPKRYLNLPDETRNTFEETDDGEVIVHTGDIGIRHENGIIEFINRKDLMVKINGMRVDPSETEASILQMEGISGVAVKSFEDDTDKVFLCAYYTTEAETDIDADRIRAFLKNKLPYYMIPSFFVKMKSLPLNNSGKLDRFALKKPEISSFLSEYVAPENPIQERICNVFAEVLFIHKIGITDDFFSLGGDSVKVMTAASKLYDVHVTVKMIYKYRTPEKIADATKHLEFIEDISEEDAEKAKNSNPAIIPYQRHYIDYQLYAPKGNGGFIPFYLEIPEPRYTASEIASALEKVLKHFAVFGTVFEYGNDGELRLFYKPEYIKPVEIVESSENDAFDWCMKDFQKVAPVIGRLQYRIRLFVCEGKYILYMVFQHFIMDGASLINMLKALMDTLEGKRLWVDTYYYYLEVLEKTYKLPDYQNKQKEFLRLYFSNGYERLPKFDRFTKNGKHENIWSKISVPYSDFMRKAEAKDISIGNLFNAAGLLALKEYNGSDKVQLCWIYTGRYEEWMKKIVGITMTALPIAIDFSVTGSIDKLLKEINRQNSENIPYATLSPSLMNNSPVLNDSLTMIYESVLKYPDNLFENSSEKNSFFYSHRTSLSNTMECVLYPSYADDSVSICTNINTGVYKKETAEVFGKLVEKYMLRILEIPFENSLYSQRPNTLKPSVSDFKS
ncbi:MAG: AMP-binding protein [Sphaerochaetaceae bacterium]|nr:AMP-binding protein [Sphaerochaetaceae bacterium]